MRTISRSRPAADGVLAAAVVMVAVAIKVLASATRRHAELQVLGAKYLSETSVQA